MNSTNTLPTLPDVFFHGAAVPFKRIDVAKGRGRKDFGRGFYMAFSAAQAVPHDFDVVIGPTADDDTNMALKYYYDGTYGDPGSEDAKRMLLRVLDVDKLGFQLFVGSQSVADRLVKKLEVVDWREYV